MPRPSVITDPGRRFYELVAPIYDQSSGEGPLYATSRARAIELLRLRPGATVLDVACGTGRNHDLIEQRIGPADDWSASTHPPACSPVPAPGKPARASSTDVRTRWRDRPRTRMRPSSSR